MTDRDPRELVAATAEDIAQAFHEAYERLAPEFSYKTRDASAVPWSMVPEKNRRLMCAVADEVMMPVAQVASDALDRAERAEAVVKAAGELLRTVHTSTQYMMSTTTETLVNGDRISLLAAALAAYDKGEP